MSFVIASESLGIARDRHSRPSVVVRQPIAESMEKFLVQSAVLIATHHVIPFDLAVIDTCDGKRLFSFLSIEWAILADVDCESEQYRFLGTSDAIESTHDHCSVARRNSIHSGSCQTDPS